MYLAMINVMLYLAITASIFATSILSGVLGMAGGMVLMAILVLSLGVGPSMVLHGVVQGAANGSRAFFLREYLRYKILPPYLVGSGIAVLGFSLLMFVPNASVVLILVGLFPWLARITKKLQGLDITQPLTAIVCGFTVTCAQFLAGASGPILDIFYLKSPLSRQEIVANKALTQTLGHVFKTLYYGFVVTQIVELTDPTVIALPGWFFALGMVTAIAGTKVGTKLLMRWNDSALIAASQRIILTIATLCIFQGIWELVS